MSRKQNDERVITLDDNYTIRCWWEKTSYGFRHLATLSLIGSVVARNKCCYYNRTWERYQYESVIHGLIRSHFDDALVAGYITIADAGGREKSVGVEKDCAPLKFVAALAGVAKLLSETPEQEARLKKSALSTVPGIDFPEGFDNLPVEERNRRLDAAVKSVTE